MTTEKPAKVFSCARCFDRKVKCDKQHPCSACVRSKVECIFRAPSTSRRKRRRHQEDILLARLRHCEDLLRKQGVDVPAVAKSGNSADDDAASQESPEQEQDLDGGDANTAPPKKSYRHLPYSEGRLIVGEGKSRFVENNLWTSVTEEFQEPKEVIEDSSDENDYDEETPRNDGTDFLFGLAPSRNITQHLHPPPDHILRLWQVFLENFNPMTKLVHRPTLEKSIIIASSNLENLNRGLETLMFSIYGSAVLSMTDRDCETNFGEGRTTLLARYRHGTRIALARAKFLATSDLVVLQAFTIYLLSMRSEYDARTLWTLVGVAGRIAQSLGIHRDGPQLGLPPFETELRRRLWWQIAILDFRSAELTGSGRFADFSLFDTQVPTNVHDEDLWPGMTEPPVGHVRPTEMIACLLRCEIGMFWKEKISQGTMAEGDYTVVMQRTQQWNDTLENRDERIDELERHLEEKFLKYCELSNPIEFQTLLIARSAISGMRLMAHHPRRYPNESDVPEEERKIVWDLSVKLLETDNVSHSSKLIQRFLWHTNVYFQWQAMIYILGELRKHTLGEDVDKAWVQMGEIFENHPDFVTDHKRPLHVAVGSLVLKAYDARERALIQNANKFSSLPPRTPEYITLLRQQRQILNQRRTPSQTPQELSNSTSSSSPSVPPITNDRATPQYATLPVQSQIRSTQNQYQNQQQQHQARQNYMQTSAFHTPLSWDSPSTTFLGGNGVLPFDTMDSTFAPDFMMVQDIAATDWSQWDNLIQNFDLPK